MTSSDAFGAWRVGVLVAMLSPVVAMGCGGATGGDGRCGPARATVERVIDGDTIELSTGEHVRYLLVDTPESTTEVECYGPEAAELNRALVEGRAVDLAYDDVCTDGYGRLLAFVSIGGRDVGRLMLERGYACVLFIPPDGAARADEFDDVEARARAEGRGLWSACEARPCG